MRLSKAAEHGSPSFVNPGHDGSKSSPDDEEHFRTIFEGCADPNDRLPFVPACDPDDPREGEQERQLTAHVRSRQVRGSAHASCAPSESEQDMHAFAPPARIDIDALKVRLTNGPLAGSEVEVYRHGQRLSIRVRRCATSADNALPVPPKELARALSTQTGLDVSVEMDGSLEYRNAPTAAP